MFTNCPGSSQHKRKTRVVKVDAHKVVPNGFDGTGEPLLNGSTLHARECSSDSRVIEEAASLIRGSDVPVAFPTETVYGLGADATRSSAVQGIYQAKQRPSDNPLIVHVSSLSQLRKLLNPNFANDASSDPVLEVYLPLVQRFWPGPLTILLPLPKPSPFAPEVTAGLNTVGVRMPASRLALALIEAAGVPLAAPSANASTRPSPTTAAHVLHDLDGRIDLILDGGPCEVGLESTVVDGLSDPPLILRPGGISIEQLRACPGWETVQVGYGIQMPDDGAPKAPGMKYKHYSPVARVFLLNYDDKKEPLHLEPLPDDCCEIGVVRTSDRPLSIRDSASTIVLQPRSRKIDNTDNFPVIPQQITSESGNSQLSSQNHTYWIVELGPDPLNIARGLFSALRSLDSKGVSVILVESMDPNLGETSEAIMNRLRKAADREIGP